MWEVIFWAKLKLSLDEIPEPSKPVETQTCCKDFPHQGYEHNLDRRLPYLMLWNSGRCEMWFLILKSILEPKVSADWHVDVDKVLTHQTLKLHWATSWTELTLYSRCEVNIIMWRERSGRSLHFLIFQVLWKNISGRKEWTNDSKGQG